MVLFFDTNVYEGAKFNLNDNKFKKLRKYLGDDKIILLYTSVTVGEVKNHIRRRLEDEVQKYNHLVRKDIPILSKDSKYGLEEISCEDVTNHVIKEFEDFFNSYNVVRVPLNPLDAEELIEDHFAQRLPFENKKPNEFKDAIMIKAIKAYQKQIEEEILVVSNDEGFRASFPEPEFKVVNYFGQALMAIETEVQARLRKVEEAVEKAIEKGTFRDYLCEIYGGLKINRESSLKYTCWGYEIIEQYLELMNVEEYDVYENQNMCLADIRATFVMDVDMNYLNPEKISYDSETNKYSLEEYDACPERHQVVINVPLLLYLDEEETDNKIEIGGCEVKDQKHIKYIDLDDNTFIKAL